ncbi:MAG: VCBS repeat-containing protein, partial [Acidobacteriota bacterium]
MNVRSAAVAAAIFALSALFLLGAVGAPANGQTSSAVSPATPPSGGDVETPKTGPTPPKSIFEMASRPVERKPERAKIEPPDGKWLVDENGNEYYLHKLPKQGLRFSRIGDDMIRTWEYRIPMKVGKEDEENFYIKVYKPKPRRTPMDEMRPQITPERRAEVEAGYTPDIDQGDRLTLEAFDRGLPRTGMWRNGFDVADMNGDGHLDLIHGVPRKDFGGPRIFLGDSQGNWTQWNLSLPEAIYNYGDAVAGDLNNDGHMDMVLAMHLRGILAMVGNGQGGFRLWTQGIDYEGPDYQGPSAFTSRGIALADWNQDGNLDIIALSEGPRGFDQVEQPNVTGRRVYLNNGNGTWRVALRPRKPALVFGDEVAVADWNSDGFPDLFTSTSRQGFGELMNLNRGAKGGWDSQTFAMLRPNAWVWSVAAGDFDADGTMDLVYGYNGGELGIDRTGIDVVLNPLAEDGGTRISLMYGTGTTAEKSEDDRIHIRNLAAGDIDGDGQLDIVAGSRNGQLFFFLGDGEGGFVQEAEVQLAQPQKECQTHDIELVDFTGDGRAEIVAGFAGEQCPNGGALFAWQTADRPAG